MCDGGTVEEWLEETRQRIDRQGFTMVSVGGGKSSWTYTIGLVESLDHPELVVTGLGGEYEQSLIGDVVAHIKNGERFEIGDTALHGVPLRIGHVHPTQWRCGRFNLWLEYYDAHEGTPPEPAAVQILWPNDDDVFPPDRHFCDAHPYCQPVLSVPVAHDVNRPIGRARGKAKKKQRSSNTKLQPDLLVFRRADVDPDALRKPPVLAVETLSPSTRSLDLGTKKLAIAGGGAAHYWIVDPLAPSITAFDLVGDEFVEVGYAAGDEALALSAPFAITIVPARLVD